MSNPSTIRWARLNYADGKKVWHATYGELALCGAVSLNHPRAEFRDSKPEQRLCRRCMAKLGVRP